MFNNKKNDPLVDSVRKIMEENELRRKVEAGLCEELGIVSRKALPFEHYNNYDALLEQRIQEAMKKDDKRKSDDKKIQTQDDYGKMREKMVGKGTDRATTRKLVGLDEQGPTITQDAKNPLPNNSAMDRVKNNLGLNNVTGHQDPNYKPSGGPSQSDKEALTKKIDQLDEKAYSAKAARAGKDIGEPGKKFEKIANSAEERYGSEEKGKKVAGAILAKIRAKHMKEEILDETLSKKASAGEWIKDFEKSDDPRFKGDSKEKRKERAIAAYMKKQRNESIELNSVMEEIRANLGEEAYQNILNENPAIFQALGNIAQRAAPYANQTAQAARNFGNTFAQRAAGSSAHVAREVGGRFTSAGGATNAGSVAGRAANAALNNPTKAAGAAIGGAAAVKAATGGKNDSQKPNIPDNVWKQVPTYNYNQDGQEVDVNTGKETGHTSKISSKEAEKRITAAAQEGPKPSDVTIRQDDLKATTGQGAGSTGQATAKPAVPASASAPAAKPAPARAVASEPPSRSVAPKASSSSEEDIPRRRQQQTGSGAAAPEGTGSTAMEESYSLERTIRNILKG